MTTLTLKFPGARKPGRPSAESVPTLKARNLRILWLKLVGKLDPASIAESEGLTARQVRNILREARGYAPHLRALALSA